MLNVKMVSTRVRTAAWCRDPAEALGDVVTHVRRRLGRSRPWSGSAIREMSSAPSSTNTAWVANGHAIPTANRAAPIGGPASWLTVMNPIWSRALAMREVVAVHDHRQQRDEALSANVSAVPSRNRATRRPARSRRCRWRSTATSSDEQGAEQSTVDHEPSPVEPVGQRAGVQTEQQRRRPLQQRGQRHQERVVGLRRDEQRTGGEGDAVADVADPRRRQQPAEPADRAEPGPASRRVCSLTRR